jgi:hypothetical protein
MVIGLQRLDQSVIALQVTDPSSRQRGRYKITNPQLSKENVKERGKKFSKIWS